MPPRRDRQGHSWNDSTRDGHRRADFRAAAPRLLRGEDPEFAVDLERLVGEEQNGR